MKTTELTEAQDERLNSGFHTVAPLQEGELLCKSTQVLVGNFEKNPYEIITENLLRVNETEL